MVNVDLKGLFKRFNKFCTSTLEGAAGICMSRTHYEVSIEHFLLKALETPKSDISLILKHFEINWTEVQKILHNTLEDFKSGNTGKPVFSPLLLDWIQDGWLIASVDLFLQEIRTGALLLAMLSDHRRYAGGAYYDYIYTISVDELHKNFLDIVAESVETPAEGLVDKEKLKDRDFEKTALNRFTSNFTELAKKEEIDPVFGRDREIRQMIDILARRRKNNPIVVGEAGVGKTALVEGLALKIVQQSVPDILKNVEILALDLGLLQAGAGVKGEFENRLKSVIAEVKASPTPIILFIDEAHTMIGAGGSAGGSDAANLLKPALARGELRTVAATTWSEYKKYFEKDPALSRRFQPVKLDEPSEDDAIVIIRGLKEKYETSHNVYIREEGVEAAVKLSSRYIHGRQLPDKAVDLLDTSSARVKVGLTSQPDVLEDIYRQIQLLEQELTTCKRDALTSGVQDEKRIEDIKKAIDTKKESLKTYEEKWQQEKEWVEKIISLRDQLINPQSEDKEQKPIMEELEDAIKKLEEVQGKEPLIHFQVDEEAIAAVVADWTGIPIGKMLRDEAGLLMEIEKRLTERVKGQSHAIETISQVIRASKTGVGNPNTPLGVFLLVGPSGVGKTETAIVVADLLFGGERFMSTINMSEFQEKHTVSRLIGSPPGYVGYGEGGVLTEAVRQRPYSVVLLDEVEKADPEVMNLFYQVFDKGMLADGEGRVINFKNTVIFMTSNLASNMIEQMPSDTSMEQIIAAIRPVLSKHFKPALLARMTIVPYLTISSEIMREIGVLKFALLAERLRNSHNIAFSYDEAVLETIIARCSEVETGARNIDHILNSTLLPAISSELLTRMADETLLETLQVGIGEEGEFTFTFK